MDVRIILLVSFLVGMVGAGSWSYTGEKGKDNWNTVYKTECGGSSQSPIDIKCPGDACDEDDDLGEFTFTNMSNTTGSYMIKNNGYTLSVFPPSDNIAQVSGGGLKGTYYFYQFHFHWGSDDTKGSEHQLNGKAYPLEVHLIFFNSKYADASTAMGNPDGLAVFGVFFKVGDENTVIKKFQSDMVDVVNKDANKTLTPWIDLSTMLPESPGKYYRYSGSLTTPNCNEVVTWTVFDNMHSVSTTQLEEFRKLTENSTDMIQDNFRDPQALNSRKIKTSFDSSDASSASISFLSVSGFLALVLLLTN